MTAQEMLEALSDAPGEPMYVKALDFSGGQYPRIYDVRGDLRWNQDPNGGEDHVRACVEVKPGMVPYN